MVAWWSFYGGQCTHSSSQARDPTLVQLPLIIMQGFHFPLVYHTSFNMCLYFGNFRVFKATDMTILWWTSAHTALQLTSCKLCSGPCVCRQGNELLPVYCSCTHPPASRQGMPWQWCWVWYLNTSQGNYTHMHMHNNTCMHDTHAWTISEPYHSEKINRPSSLTTCTGMTGR